jgi:ankyrin repeat protein
MSFDIQFPNEITLIDYINDNKPLNIIDSNGNSLLIFACDKKYSDSALKILQHPADQINLSYSSIYSNTTALLEACKNALIDVIDKMLDFEQEEVGINYKNDDNETAISVLCNDKTIMNENDKTVLILKLINKYAEEIDLSIQNKDGNTPLMLSIISKLYSVTKEMMDRFNAKELNLDAINKKGDDAEALADNENLYEITQGIRYLYRQQMMEEEEENMEIPTINQDEDSDSQDGSENSEVDIKQQFKQGKMPPIPQYEKQTINTNEEGYDPIMMENVNIKSYLNEDEDNIVIKMNDKVYLSSRDNFKKQINDALVFECVEADIKYPNNIVSNLPLYNLKMIGINVETNQVGIIPEYIYYHSSGIKDGIEDLIYTGNSQLFSIIPIHDKMLVSVISWNELQRLGTGFSGASAVHCQAGQGGLTGIIVEAEPEGESQIAGKRNKTKNKKRVTFKKISKTKKGKKTLKVNKINKSNKKGRKNKTKKIRKISKVNNRHKSKSNRRKK